MQSHDDNQHPGFTNEQFNALFEKAKRMTDEGTNRITAGAPGETVLLEAEVDGILIRRMPEDEHGVIRVSLGRIPAVEKSSYLVFRGDPRKVLGMLERAVGAMRKIGVEQ